MARRMMTDVGASKPSAEERTVPLPFHEVNGATMFIDERGIEIIQCACGLKASVEIFKKKNECPSCGRRPHLPDAKKEAADPQEAMDFKNGEPPFEQVETKKRMRKLAVEEKASEKCAECGVTLTQSSLGVFWPCGHDPRSPSKAEVSKPMAHVESKPIPLPDPYAPKDTSGNSLLVMGTETVTVTWGEEVFSPIPMHTFRAPSFSTTTLVRSGETRQQAIERCYNELLPIAEKKRTEKYESYMKFVAAMGGGKR